jgi:hypothetical protein
MAKRGKTARPAGRKPETPREALAEARAMLHTVAGHIEEALKAYRAHKLPKPIAGDDVAYAAAARGERVQRLADVRRLRRFVRAVEAYLSAGNKKSLDQLLGLKAGRGKPVVQDRRDKILEKLLKIVLLRSTGRQWKVIGRECGMTPQAAKRLFERELPNLPEALAKETATRMKRKPSPIGTGKASSAALGKEIAAQNRRAHEAKAVADRRAESQPAKSAN